MYRNAFADTYDVKLEDGLDNDFDLLFGGEE